MRYEVHSTRYWVAFLAALASSTFRERKGDVGSGRITGLCETRRYKRDPFGPIRDALDSQRRRQSLKTRFAYGHTSIMEQVNQDNTSYLLPDYESDNEGKEILRHYFDLIFEEQLAGWWQDETAWPSRRDLATFLQWFDVEFHSLVLDLVDEPLLHEE